MDGLVSVIIPTYNRFESLNLAIQSVQAQSYKNFEIIVINDCSTQKEYYNGDLEKYPKTKVLHLPQNLRQVYKVTAAQGKTRDEGMKVAQGEWIAFLDDDDYWFPRKLERQLRRLSYHPELKMCSTNMFHGNGSYFRKIEKKLYFKDVTHRKFNYEIIKQNNLIINSSVLIHRTICDKVGEFALGINEDWEYWLRALKFTDCYYLRKPLVYYDSSSIQYYS